MCLPARLSSSQKLEKRVFPLRDLWDLAASDGVEAFSLNYTQMLTNTPDCPVGGRGEAGGKGARVPHTVGSTERQRGTGREARLEAGML